MNIGTILLVRIVNTQMAMKFGSLSDFVLSLPISHAIIIIKIDHYACMHMQ